jgi:hypothetical protein
MKLLLIAGILCVAIGTSVTMVGCSKATISRNIVYLRGGNAKVEVYSGGKIVKTYYSDGEVKTESNSDGWFLKDKKTGKLILVSGTVIIEEL